MLRLRDGLFPPLAGDVEHQTDKEGGKACQRVTQPEAVVLHLQTKAEQHGKADAHDHRPEWR